MTLHPLHPQLCPQRAGRRHAQSLGRQARPCGSGPQCRQSPSGRISRFALKALNNAGVDSSALHSKAWDIFSANGAPSLSIVITVCDSAAAETCPVFFGAAGSQPVKVHWGDPDPSNAEGGDKGKRRAFELTCQAIGYRMLQLLTLPLDSSDRASLQAALVEIGRS